MSIVSDLVSGLEKHFGEQFANQHQALAQVISDAILPILTSLDSRLRAVEVAAGINNAPPKTPTAPPSDTTPSTPTSQLTLPNVTP